MPRLLDLQVTQSPEQLKKMMSEQSANWARERLQALYLYASGIAPFENSIARIVGKDVSSIRRWFRTYEKEGLAGLLKPRNNRGRKAHLSEALQEQVKKKLANPEGFDNYEEIRQWLLEEHGVEVSHAVIYRVVHNKLKARPKVARPSNTAKDPEQGEKLKKN
ncbi:MAG: helix-turn-helix domain-containing protein [Anaerolineae bacterium]|nr:helix-turn-helix domain-containing protein [Gloeobacterales cyanobacterium ES-bin-313]